MQFSLTPGNMSDFKAGKELIAKYDFPTSVTHLVMDKGYSSYEIHAACKNKDIEAVVPPKSNMKHPWKYNRNLYVYRNEVERFFSRLKNFRRIATRYDKLDVAYTGFILLGMILLLLRYLC